MFNFNNTTIPTALDERISKLLEELEAQTGDTAEYGKIVANLTKLMDLRNNALKTQIEKTKIDNEKVKIDNDHVSREQDHSINVEKIVIEKDKVKIEQDKLDLEEGKFEDAQESRRSWKPSADAVVGAAASVAGILLVLHYERIGVITSKALGFVSKMTK